MIIITKRKSERVYNSTNSLFVTFPYSPEILATIKSIKVRLFNPQTKEWEIPEYLEDQLKLALDHSGFTYKFNNLITETYENSISDKPFEQDLSNYTLPDDIEFEIEPFEHQKIGIAYALSHPKYLLGDQMGLGKTYQGINTAVYRMNHKLIKNCLIICGVNTLKYNWQEEIKKYSDKSCRILGTRFNAKRKTTIKGSAEKLFDLQNLEKIDADFYIINIEALRYRNGKSFPIAEEINKRIDSGEIGMVIIDEVHKSKNPTSDQGKAMLKIAENKNLKYIIPMSGSLYVNSPMDFYIPLRLIGVENHSFWQYKNYFCVMGGFGGSEVLGYKNLDRLRETLKTCMLRRTKDEVLNLPPKVYLTEYVEMSAKQTAVYNEVLQGLRADADKISRSVDPLAMLIRLRQATGYTGILSTIVEESAKLDRMEELVEEITNDNEKVIIFSQWEEITKEAKRRLTKYQPLYITGSVKENERELQKNMFQDDNEHKVIIGTIGAMGTGLTLNRATNVIFLDSPWNKATKEQAEDRAHRIGTKATVNIITLVTKDTIDERIEDIVYKKGLMSDYLVDGKLNKTQVDNLLHQILN